MGTLISRQASTSFEHAELRRRLNTRERFSIFFCSEARVGDARSLISDGSGLVALSYRGYGGSSGRPCETGLVEDAAAAYAFTIARYPAERIVLWGESLGSALALAMAAENPVGHIVLEAPFTSAADVGAQHYWFVPVRLFMKDQFRRRQGHGTRVGGTRRGRRRCSRDARRAALWSDPGAQALRAYCQRRAQ